MKIKKILNSKMLYDSLLVSIPSNKDNYVSKGGIHLTGNQMIEHVLLKCRVDKVGQGSPLSTGEYMEIPVKEGDIVLVERAVGVFLGVQEDGRDYRVIRPKNIVMILDKEVNEDGLDGIENVPENKKPSKPNKSSIILK